ncbi:hypothetical protein [Parafilimonas terrae]|uniref:Lipocalin-like domain-containing protein n=1 Tax=Parafilimonas terrae TaxID=1465490 RepID=A0A1I5Z639_9BACT|nr:hypothetical protein [Parafilimonas terrae]SFQ51928.1 hypothetical protein SAMN05444277_1172 [Parafilimonas terrae]
MKSRVLITIASLAIIVTACHKNVSSADALQGRWELRSVYGGYGSGGGNYEPGNGNIYFFTSDKYRHYVNNVLNDSGSYSITKGKNPDTGESIDAILFDFRYTVPCSISHNNLKLYYGSIPADGSIATYERIND